jgi:hypothetical protein
MALERRLKSGLEWGFFLGICTWLLATGVSNKIPNWGVWSIILSRTLLGFLIGILKWDVVWWIRGLLFGLAVSVLHGFMVLQWPEFGWLNGFVPGIVTAMIVGVVIERALLHKPDQEQSQQGVS